MCLLKWALGLRKIANVRQTERASFKQSAVGLYRGKKDRYVRYNAHMPKQESKRPMRESAIPVPIGDESITYSGRMIEVVIQQMRVGSGEIVYEKARRSPGTRLLITSPDHNILLTREYRDEVRGWDYRLPGGKVFDSLEEYSEAVKSGVDLLEKSKQAAQKEALEEVGATVEDINYLYTSRCGATVEWDLHYFEVQLPTEDLDE